MRYLYNILALSFIILCTFSCKSKKEDQHILKIGVMSSTDLLPYAIAKKEGFFKKYGVEVQIEKFYSANDRDAAFQTGNIDGTITDLTGAIIQKANGIDLEITSKEYGVFHILAGKNTSIQTLKEIKNKHVASSKNTVIDFVIDLALESVELSPQDINRQEVNKIPIRLEMLRNGQTDATGLPEPFISIALKEGAKSLANIHDLGYNITCMVFQTSAIESKQKQIYAMYQAYNDAVDFMGFNKRTAYEEILITDLGVPEELVESIYLPEYEIVSLPANKDIEATIKWLKEKELIPADFTPDNLLNEKFSR